jgi:hypothetical protein
MVCPYERLGGGDVEGAQTEPFGWRLTNEERDERGEWMPPVNFLTPIGCEEEKWHLVDLVRNKAQQVKARTVGPMEVLEQEHEWSLRSQGNKEVARLREDVRLTRRTVEAGNRRSYSDGGGWDAMGNLKPGTIGWGLSAVIAVAGQDVRTGVRCLAADRTRERGLPNAGLTADQHNVAPAMTRRGQTVLQKCHFTVSTDRRWARKRRWQDHVHATTFL